MKRRVLLSLSVAGVIASPVSALELISSDDLLPGESVFEFNRELDDGRSLFGYFVGQDRDDNGVVDSFDGEVRLLRAEVRPFDGSGAAGPADVEFEILGFPDSNVNSDESEFLEGELSLVRYNLDGSGFIGDRSFGKPERFLLFDFDGVFSDFAFIDDTSGLPIPGCTDFDPSFNCGAGLYRREATDDDGDGELEDFFFPDGFIEDPIVVTSGPRGDAIGVSEQAPVLPDLEPTDDGFSFGVPDGIPAGEIFFIDPEVAVGYDYLVEGTLFTGAQAPTQDAVPEPDGAFELLVDGLSMTLASGEKVDFATPVSSFTIQGIDVALMLDPTDPLAFVTGIALLDPSAATGLFQKPITVFVPDDPAMAPVPLPPSAALLLGGLLGAGALGARARRPRG